MIIFDLDTMETTDGLYVKLDDVIALVLRMAWVCGSLPLAVLHNLLKRGEVYEGQIRIELKD
jgi:hypothetical protein